MAQNHESSYQRSLFLFQDVEQARIIIPKFLKHCCDLNQTYTTGLIVINEDSFLPKIIPDLNKLLFLLPNIRIVKLNEITQELGQTVDFIFIDLRQVFNPNKIIILLEAVRGGGIIFILGQDKPDWLYSINENRFPNMLLESKKRKSILLNWFLNNINDNPQCISNTKSISDVISRFHPIPLENSLKAQINGIFVSEEQKDVIDKLLVELSNLSYTNSCLILVANRGRGKSATVGLMLSQFIMRNPSHKFKIIVTAPYLTNVQTIFEFISKGFNSKNIKCQFVKKNGFITGVHTSTKAILKFIPPSELNKRLKTDIIVVDEAASLPLDLLRQILRTKTKKIFISTIHGYEGAGRGFEYKILNYLENQKQIHYKKFTLHQPIRYFQGDLIEKLLNDIFFLNVEPEPSELKIQEIRRDFITLEEFKDPGFLFSRRGSPYLKQLFAILVYAHYRNQPNDLVLLADSGKHFLVGLYEKKNDNGGKLLVSSQLAQEGRMSDQEILDVASGRFIEGNLIPSVAIRHFSKDFAKLNGLRIVRIASHPSLIDKGLGRQAIELQIKRYSSYDWIGVSFGTTVKLIKFWTKFGFKSVHIRPIKTPETGEWNIVVIFPFSPSATRIINEASSDFLLQFISLLKQSLHSMKPELVSHIIRSCVPIPNYEVKITASGKYRLKNYLKGNLNFLLAVDVMYELVMKYFVSHAFNVKLSPSQEVLIIARILQGRTWGQTLGKTGLNWKTANGLIKKAIEKLTIMFIEKDNDF
ncbi:MAG: GNAT family N-acetyltransferase [Candidatus Hermodarchaeota archaeon]